MAGRTPGLRLSRSTWNGHYRLDGRLALESVVNHFAPGGEIIRRRFRYEAYYGDDGRIHDGAVSFLDETAANAEVMEPTR